ncbi:interleukin-22 receptor subunit alpha-2 isoform X2 [Ascaphus truei]|uniref:interleukin-22 receptor subunit alpha-2 isoform X2 n=1 Tax=Ascaphus truei TaxID=8439 RepID=UPI003F59A692
MVYGESQWENKTDCWGMLETWCNLTPEMSRPENKFEFNFARVKAVTANDSSKWKNTPRFHPFLDTNIGPPAVVLTPTLNSISVNITVPVMIRQSKYTMGKKKKKVHFIITVSSLSELSRTYDTTENIRNISNLTPGSSYCISVAIEFWYMKKTSSPSPEQCVTLEGTIAKEIYLGSVAAALGVFIVVCILAIYLILDKYVFHPKMQLPSNLILHGLELKAIVHREEARVFFPSTFESMELTKYVLEAKENSNEKSQNKRYISTEPWKKEYVNCRQREIDPGVLCDTTVELRNLTYVTNASENNVTVDDTNDGISAQCMYQHMERFTQPLEILDYSTCHEKQSYFNDQIAFEQQCMNKGEPHINQYGVLNCFNVTGNYAFQSYKSP